MGRWGWTLFLTLSIALEGVNKARRGKVFMNFKQQITPRIVETADLKLSFKLNPETLQTSPSQNSFLLSWLHSAFCVVAFHRNSTHPSCQHFQSPRQSEPRRRCRVVEWLIKWCKKDFPPEGRLPFCFHSLSSAFHDINAVWGIKLYGSHEDIKRPLNRGAVKSFFSPRIPLICGHISHGPFPLPRSHWLRLFWDKIFISIEVGSYGEGRLLCILLMIMLAMTWH